MTNTRPLRYFGHRRVLLHADPEVASEHLLEPEPVLTEEVAVEVIPGVDSLGLVKPDGATEHRQGRVAGLVHADAHEHHHAERDKEEDDDELQHPLKEITHVDLVD